MINSTSKLAKVKKYYELVDGRKFSRLAELFSDNVVYNRAGMIINGRDSLLDFYTNIRSLKGVHSIKNFFENQDCVIALGQFNFSSGQTVSFIDVFFFNEHNEINKRETYLLAGNQEIQ